MTKHLDPDHVPKEKPEMTEEQLINRLTSGMENLADIIQEWNTDMQHYHNEFINKLDEFMNLIKRSKDDEAE